MFRREHHRAIASILADMDADVLQERQCFFGGGTAISMLLDEYRKSVDVDFLVPSEDGYRWLRRNIHEKSFGPLFKVAPQLATQDGIRTNRYGIRALLRVNETAIKLEIVSARNALHGCSVPELPVPVLNQESLFTEKLLANADRWADASLSSRDAIDLAHMMNAWGSIPTASLNAARHAYGATVDQALFKAAQRLQDPDWVKRCCQQMDMELDASRPIIGRFVEQVCANSETDSTLRRAVSGKGLLSALADRHAYKLAQAPGLLALTQEQQAALRKRLGDVGRSADATQRPEPDDGPSP